MKTSIIKYFFVAIAAFVLYLFCQHNAYATDIYVNEFFLSTSSSAKQSVEIINMSSSEFNLGGYIIDDSQTGSAAYYTVPQNTILTPNQCIVLESADFNFNTSSADKIRLFLPGSNPKDAYAANYFEYAYSAPTANKSYLAIPDGSNNFTLGDQSLGYLNSNGQDCKKIVQQTQTPTQQPSLSPTQTQGTPQTPTATLTLAPNQPTQVITQTYSPTPTPQALLPLIINEIYPYPQSGEQEWVELYNPNNTDITATDWQLDDTLNAGSSPVKVSFTIKPNSYYVIYLKSSILNNSGDEVNLIDEKGQIVDRAEYENAPQGQSYSLAFGKQIDFCTQKPSINAQNDTCQTPTNTPTQTPTSTPTPIPVDYKNIFITEVYPYPQSGEQEWVELFNNNNFQVNLANWAIDDKLNAGSSKYSFTITLNGYEYKTIKLNKSIFNNSGQEVVNLLNVNGNVVDNFEFESGTAGTSISRNNLDSKATCQTVNTPDAQNLSCQTINTKQKANQIEPTIATTSKVTKKSQKLPNTAIPSFQKNSNSQGDQTQNAADPLKIISAISMLMGAIKAYNLWQSLKNLPV